MNHATRRLVIKITQQNAALAKRVIEAMLRMTKTDIAALETAATE